MKKLLQKLFSYKTIIVTDATTGDKETATYVKLFGFVVKVFYTPIENDEQCEYLGII